MDLPGGGSGADELEGGFDSLLARLEGIIVELEGGELRLERSLQLFQEGVEVARQACQQVDAEERRVEALLDDGSGGLLPKG